MKYEVTITYEDGKEQIWQLTKCQLKKILQTELILADDETPIKSIKYKILKQ